MTTPSEYTSDWYDISQEENWGNCKGLASAPFSLLSTSGAWNKGVPPGIFDSMLPADVKRAMPRSPIFGTPPRKMKMF